METTGNKIGNVVNRLHATVVCSNSDLHKMFMLFAIAFCVLSADAIQRKIEMPTCQTRSASSIIEPRDVNCSLGVLDRIQVCNAKIWISGSRKDRIKIYRCKTLITYWDTTYYFFGSKTHNSHTTSKPSSNTCITLLTANAL